MVFGVRAERVDEVRTHNLGELCFGADGVLRGFWGEKRRPRGVLLEFEVGLVFRFGVLVLRMEEFCMLWSQRFCGIGPLLRVAERKAVCPNLFWAEEK